MALFASAARETDHAGMSPDSLRPANRTAPFELRLLGPVQLIRAGCEVALGGPKQRAVLAVLLVEQGRTISAGRLVEDVWRGCPPPGAAKTLRSYVSRLRVLLAPDAALVTRGGGYAVNVQPDQVDAGVFERLAAAGKGALDRGDVATATARFREALSLWHGRALADVCDVEPLALEAARLEDLRLAVLEGRIDADVQSGRHAEVIGELERLLAEYPVRERLWRLLVLALYRAERQADALAAYSRARVMLAAELGLEPGEELRRLQQAVLRQDVVAVQTSRHNLPAPLTSFLGREDDLASLESLLGQARLVTLTGPGGVGKTRLALEAGERMLRSFPDGVWLVNLAGIRSPALVPAQVMEALGVRQEAGVPVLEALRFRLRAAGLLLVLDNCEHLLDACTELTGALLRGSPGLRVLATSRELLGVPGEVAYTVQPLTVPPESAGERDIAAAAAVRLFLDRASAVRGGSTAGVAPLAVAGRICRALDGLPLAIELAAARMSTLSAVEIEAYLADKFAFLAYRRHATDPRHQALRTAMDWSYDLLSPQERRLLSELSVFAGSFGLAQLAEVCSAGNQAAALEAVDRLAGKSLVSAEPAEEGTRYRLLETVRQYAADRLAEASGEEPARRRHALAFLGLADREHRIAVLSRDHDNFRAALESSMSAGDEAGPRLALALEGFWLARGLLAEGRDWLERSLAQPLDDQRLQADLLRLLGTILYDAGDLTRAGAALREGLEAAAAAGAPALHARIRVLIADIHNLQGGDAARALEECEAAIGVLESESDLSGLAEAWLIVGRLRYDRAEWPADEEALERALAYARQSGHYRVRVQASNWLAASLNKLPVPADTAIARVEQLFQAASGEPWAEAYLLSALPPLYAYTGRFNDARAALARSRSIFAGLGANLALGYWAISAGRVEMAAGDSALAEQYLRQGYETLRAITGERGAFAYLAALLAEALYALGRLDEAQQMTEQAQSAAAPDDIDPHAQWRATRAKLLARRGELSAARRLVDEAQALLRPASRSLPRAETLVAEAEVNRLAGAPDQAAACLRAALRIYEDRRTSSLAESVRAVLSTLADDRGDETP
jgi:predicted ATPase/DNA-binding SARP family transcriptional activator